MKLRRLPIPELTIDDEESFEHVALYGDLKQVLVAADYRFAVCEAGHRDAFWGRALFLNLTYWGGEADVLVDRRVPADVIAHAAWHHLAARALGTASAEALLMGEAIASAFDLYLVGRLIGHAEESGFLDTQVPAMSEAAMDAGLYEDDFELLISGVTQDPEKAFEDLRQLLFDAAIALLPAATLDDAAERLSSLADRRFYPLLHHYELSNWLLHVRARFPDARAPDPAVRDLDRALRAAPVSLDRLQQVWFS